MFYEIPIYFHFPPKHFILKTLKIINSLSVQVQNKAVLDQLRAEKFDIAFAHKYDLCPFGLIHMLGVKLYFLYV